MLDTILMRARSFAILARLLTLLLIADATSIGVAANPTQSTKYFSETVAEKIGHPTFVSPHTNPIAMHQGRVFVVNTPAGTLDVIDTATHEVRDRVNVGIDPVSVAIRPDGKEIWVSNHISDSVSVVDIDPTSPLYLQVVATVQAFDSQSRATQFDEPMGIAFANNEKAYVALSSDNQIAVVDVGTRQITNRLNITAQDPRAIKVRGDKLYVIPFESNNKTQLSGGMKDNIDGDLVTFDAVEHSIVTNSKLSLGHVLDIVKHPDMPDRDLYIFDTRTDELIETVDTLGTLLYGLTVDSKGRVFIAQTDARNDVNGRAGTKKHGLAEMDNRAFLNRITRVDHSNEQSPQPTFFDLEPLPPEHPQPGMAAATPYGISISDDDSLLVVTTAGSDQLITIDADSGTIFGRVDVDAVPRGIALSSNTQTDTMSAWVLNAVENTVSVVNIDDPSRPSVVGTVVLEDPTHPTIKRGRMAFETASASTTGTFACASCHPDGHTDQLLWVLHTPIVTGGDQIQPRTTMPIRGLRDTEPYHWDGIPGDPYGGVNAANTESYVPPNSDVSDQTTATRHLIDGGLADTMHLVGTDNANDEGKVGLLSAAQRDDMAVFLLNVPYPPAQRRAYNNEPSQRAKDGFRLFHIDGNGVNRRDVCGDCHRFPHLVSTNHPTIGMDTPTWRGAYDRFLILPQGRINMVTLPPFAALAEQGIPERELWRFTWGLREAFDPVWDMVLEHSTGYSGAFARQVTLNQQSVGDTITLDLLTALEQSAREDVVILKSHGAFIRGDTVHPVSLRYDEGRYRNDSVNLDRDTLVAQAAAGTFVGTITAHHGVKSDAEHPQPAIWTLGPIEEQSGPQRFPQLHAEQLSMTISGRYVASDSHILVDGRRVDGTIDLQANETLTVELANTPSVGMHLLQLQTPNGLISNDFIFHIAETAPPSRPLHLGELLQTNGWNHLIGDWVDVGTRGEFRLSLHWKIKNQLLELTTIDQNGPSISMIRVHPRSSNIVHSGTNHVGVVTSGLWDFQTKDGPTLAAKFVSTEGLEGELNMQLVPQSADTMLLRVGSQQLSEVQLIRKAY